MVRTHFTSRLERMQCCIIGICQSASDIDDFQVRNHEEAISDSVRAPRRMFKGLRPGSACSKASFTLPSLSAPRQIMLFRFLEVGLPCASKFPMDLTCNACGSET